MFLSLLQFFATKFLVLALHLESGSFPRPLSAREETEAFSALRAGDLAAREKLIRHNLRLVAHIVKKNYALPGDQDDLISIGTIGLMKAVDTFESDRRARFSTYASRCIENAILSPAHFGMEKRIHSFCKAAQMRQNGFFGAERAVPFFCFRGCHVRVVV
ncbi:MAG: sigma-70 family RNA polymerase sigma factor [Faecalibacterium sp.]